MIVGWAVVVVVVVSWQSCQYAVYSAEAENLSLSTLESMEILPLSSFLFELGHLLMGVEIVEGNGKMC